MLRLHPSKSGARTRSIFPSRYFPSIATGEYLLWIRIQLAWPELCASPVRMSNNQPPIPPLSLPMCTAFWMGGEATVAFTHLMQTTILSLIIQQGRSALTRKMQSIAGDPWIHNLLPNNSHTDRQHDRYQTVVSEGLSIFNSVILTLLVDYFLNLYFLNLLIT
jgi:hypothetical protein